ncbi:MAG: hypothetical protein P4L00_05700 [Candidatus Acidoferrales bacterium]|nr:hypothetical protein [Candidatus Acidoferrales bacterium]
MSLRRCALLISSSVLFCMLTSSAFAGTVMGTVRNGTTGKPAAGVEMILIQLQGGMQPVANTKTDADGHYKFDHPGLGAGPMLIRAVYRGVNYHEPATPDKTTVDMQVFEPTDKPSAISVTVHAVIVQPNGSELAVTEEYNVSNKTQPPLAYYRADGDFVFSLPEGAELGNVAAGAASGGMPVVQSPVDKGKNSHSIAYPFRPGDSQVSLTYKLPYPGNQTSIPIISRYAVEHLGVFAPPSVQISGGGFTAAGQAQGFSAYTHDSVAANTPLLVSVSGTAPPPAPEGAAAGNAPGDDTQNPSVNSRIETGTEAPVASVTTLPARLDSLKWIIVGGFVALFALGSIYVSRQPKSAVAAEAASVKIPAAPPAPAKAPGSGQPAPYSSGAAGVAANLDREVRGSLDELKDVLFRLELRREAGTISPADYTRERDRVQKALRDLVKG